MRTRSASTLVELLVVIATIAVLVAMLLPSDNAARESARRIDCIKKFKQLTLACVNHESTFGNFSAGLPVFVDKPLANAESHVGNYFWHGKRSRSGRENE